MGAVAKILLGVILMAGSAYGVYYSTYSTMLPNLWNAFLVVVEGVLPPLVFLIGLFVVWLELDELKIEKEMNKETSKFKVAEPVARPRKAPAGKKKR